LLPIALDAAHIRWVQAAGSDEDANGLDLCVLHHELFDRGRAVPSAACCG
jgi:putative restriction endonuclease